PQHQPDSDAHGSATETALGAATGHTGGLDDIHGGATDDTCLPGLETVTDLLDSTPLQPVTETFETLADTGLDSFEVLAESGDILPGIGLPLVGGIGGGGDGDYSSLSIALGADVDDGDAPSLGLGILSGGSGGGGGLNLSLLGGDHDNDHDNEVQLSLNIGGGGGGHLSLFGNHGLW
ncbi:MAG: hypothetical protein AB7J63_19510, partial [Vicinamibacterales bacterium]